MNTVPCRREEELDESIRMGRWPEGSPEEFRHHVAACPACSELAALAMCLRLEAEHAQSQASLPNAGLVWWKARLAARRTAAEQATRPVIIAQRAGVIAGALAAASLAAWQWPLLKDAVALSDEYFSNSAHSPVFLGLFGLSIAVTVIAASAGIYLILTER